MKQPLAKQIKRKFSDKRLDTEQLAKLQSLQSRWKNEAPKPSRKRSFLSLGSSGVFLLVLFFFIGYWFRGAAPTTEHYTSIAEEVAYNHFKMKPLEVTSHSIHEVSKYFSKLDFSPIQPRQSELGAVLLGGRYCSLKGIAAAQLRYQNNSTGAYSSLYQVPYDKALYGDIPSSKNGDAPAQIKLRGLSIQLWVEDNLLMVSAKPQE